MLDSLTVPVLGVLALAVFRLTSLLVNEAGPWDIFHLLRRKAGITYDQYSHKVTDNELGRMLLCSWCTSMWVSFGVVLVWAVLPDWGIYLFLPFALSSVSIVVQEALDKLKP